MGSLEQTCVRCGCKTSNNHHDTISGILCNSCWDKWGTFFGKERKKGNKENWLNLWNNFINEKIWSVS